MRPGENARLTLEQGNKLEERLTRNRTRPPDPNQNSRTAPPPPRTRAVPKGWGPLVAPSPWVVFPRTQPRKSPAATFPPKLGSQGQHRRTVRGGRGHRGRPGWVPPETVAGVSKVASWVSARSWGTRGGGDHGSGEAGVQSERGSPGPLAVPSSPERAELREARAARERKRASREPLTEADGARRPFVCGRGAGALRPVAPALARPSSRRLPDSPARARARPPPALPPPRLRPQPRPCPGPRAPTCCGGDSWSPSNRTGNHPAGTQTRRRPLLSSRVSAPPAWTSGPGATWASRWAPALQISCRSSSGVLTPASVGGSLKARSLRKGCRDVELSLSPGRSLVFASGQPLLPKPRRWRAGRKSRLELDRSRQRGNLSGREPPLAEGLGDATGAQVTRGPCACSRSRLRVRPGSQGLSKTHRWEPRL